MLGVDKNIYDSLCESVDTVIHNGAKVDYAAPYSSHKGVNVNGTVELIKFCFEATPKSLQYLSTLAVFGPVGSLLGVKDLYEDTDMAASVEPLQSDMGYAQSKWVAEQILLLARARGLPVSVFRPGFILCDSKTGASNTEDFMVRCTMACTEIGYYPLLENQGKEFLTVDYASEAIITLMKKESAMNQCYHLCRPDASKHPLITEYFEMLEKHNYDLQGVDFSEWVGKLSSAVLDDPNHPMLALMPMMAETIREDRTRWEIYNNMPTFHCENTRRELQGTGCGFTFFDDELMSKYIGNLKAKGLLEDTAAVEDVGTPLSQRRSTFVLSKRRSTLIRRESSARGFRPSLRESARGSVRRSAGRSMANIPIEEYDAIGPIHEDGAIGEDTLPLQRKSTRQSTRQSRVVRPSVVRPSGRRVSCLSSFI